jgi:hypothetical protein
MKTDRSASKRRERRAPVLPLTSPLDSSQVAAASFGLWHV